MNTPVLAYANTRESSEAVAHGRLVVETDQGQQVGLVMDSRTVVPGEVAPGTPLRAEFTQMKDGRYSVSTLAPPRSRIAAGFNRKA